MDPRRGAGQGSIKMGFKFHSLKRLAPEASPHSVLWGLTVVREPEARRRGLRVGVELQPQGVGGAAEGQASHGRAAVGAEEGGRSVSAVVHLETEKRT